MTKRRPKPKATIPAMPWDQGADGPANRIGLIDQERGHIDLATGRVINPNRVFGKVRMPICQRYARQGRITEAHAAAAARLYAAYAGYPDKDPLARITDRVDGGGDADPNVTLLDRRREFYAMWQAVPQPCKPVLEHVVLNDLPISELAGARQPEVAAEFLARLVRGLEALG